MLLFDLLTESQAFSGKITHINNHKVISPRGGDYGARRIEVGRGVNAIAFHAQHEGAQVLYGGVAVDKKNAMRALNTGHGKLPLEDWTGCSQITPMQAAARGPFILVPLSFYSEGWRVNDVRFAAASSLLLE